MAIFSSPDQVNQAIQDAAAMLGIARPALGICCTSRGSVYGVLCFRDGSDAPWLDCSDCPRSISGDSRACTRLSFDSDARHSALLTAHSLESLPTPGRTVWWRDPVLNLWHELTHQTPVRTCCVGGCRNLAQAWKAFTILQVRGDSGEGCSIPEAGRGCLCRADRRNPGHSQGNARHGHPRIPALPVQHAAAPAAVCRY